MKVKAEEIIKTLLNRFDHSVLSKQGSKRNLRIQFIMKKDMPEYFDYENYRDADNLNQDIQKYVRLGFVSAEYEDDLLKSVELNFQDVDKTAEYFHYVLEHDYHVRLRKLFERYDNCGIDAYVRDVIEKIDTYKSVKQLTMENLSDQEKILTGLSEMMNLEEEISERIFSVRIYGNSKEFERLRTKMIFLLKRYFSDEEEDSEVLAQYHIVRNPGHVVLKGNGILKVKESILQISDFEEGITLTSRDVRNLEIISLGDMKIMTIENLTSFYQFHQEGVLSVYLGGYHNTIRRELLKKIYEKYPEKQYCHFGDIDAGGFYILNHLIERTGIPFSAFCMDTDTLQKYKEKWLPLSEHDRVRLEKLLGKSEYRDVIQFMMDQNCKLEQENIIL